MNGEQGKDEGHRARCGWKGYGQEVEEEEGQRVGGRRQWKLSHQERHQTEEGGGQGEAEGADGAGSQHPVLVERFQLQRFLDQPV